MQAGGDGFGWRVTAEHMTFQDPGVFIPRHICKVPGREEENTELKKMHNRKKGKERDEDERRTSFGATWRHER